MIFARSILALGVATTLLTGCSSNSVMLEDTVKRTAMPVFMVERKIPGHDFIFEAWERVYQRNAPATIYIEGDGDVGSSSDPTPIDPYALRLAAQDSGTNVIWLARPCQYVKGWRGGKSCPSEYWKAKRFAPEVIEDYQIALDNIKSRYGTSGFNLVGYDGGAAIATILSAQRDDVLSLRTVAGNLDPQATDELHKATYQGGSLTPVDFAPGVANVPQRHFIGEQDNVTPPAVYHSFAQNVVDARCMNVTLVDGADHDSGWVEKWKALLSMPTDCAAPPKPVTFDPTPLDGGKGYKK